MSRNTQQYGASSVDDDDGRRTPRRDHHQSGAPPSGHLSDRPVGFQTRQPVDLPSSRSFPPSGDTSFASQASEAYAEASLASSSSSPDRGTPFDNILNHSPRSTSKNGCLRRRKSVALQSGVQPRGVSKSTRRESLSSAFGRHIAESGEPSTIGSRRGRPPSFSVSAGDSPGSRYRTTSRLSLSNVLSSEPVSLPPISRVSSPFRPENRPPSGLTTPTLPHLPGPLPAQPPTPGKAFGGLGVSSSAYFPPTPTMPMVPVSPSTFGSGAAPISASQPGSKSAMYDMVASLIRSGGSDSGSRSDANGPPVLAMDLSQGIVEVQLDSTSGSKNSDQKRRNNAEASKRFRQRKKDVTIQQNKRMQELETSNKQQQEKIERLERELEQERRARHEAENIIQRAQQQGVTIQSLMTPLPPISSLPADTNRTPGMGLMEQRGDYFGSGAMESLPPTAASTPGLQSRNDYFGVMEPNVSRAPSVGPLPAVPVPRISPPPAIHRRGHVPTLPSRPAPPGSSRQ